MKTFDKIRTIVTRVLRLKDTRRPAEPPHEPKEGFRERRTSPLDCPCGNVVWGDWSNADDVTRCSACGQPVSPPPPQDSPTSSESGPPDVVSSEDRALSEIVRVPPELLAEATVADPPRQAQPALLSEPASHAATEPPPPGSGQSAEPARTSTLPLWRRIGVTRLILTGAALMLTATAIWSFRSYQQARYIRELSANLEAGRKALEQGDFIEAQRLLRVADHAARGLGGESPQERLAMQLNRETYLWSNLSVNSLQHFFDARSGELAGGDARELENEFAHQFKGRTLIVSGWLTRDPSLSSSTVPGLDDDHEGENADHDAKTDTPTSGEPSSPPRESAQLEWAVCGEDYRVELDLRNISLFDELKFGESREIVFGLEIAGLTRSSSDPHMWKLQMFPQRCALITLIDPLLDAGWPATDSLTALLAKQRSWLEIEP